jgi:hypothetical protein
VAHNRTLTPKYPTVPMAFGDAVQKSKIPTRLEFVRGSFTYFSNSHL